MKKEDFLELKKLMDYLSEMDDILSLNEKVNDIVAKSGIFAMSVSDGLKNLDKIFIKEYKTFKEKGGKINE